jgi:hypothetical protein
MVAQKTNLPMENNVFYTLIFTILILFIFSWILYVLTVIEQKCIKF